LTQLLLVVIMKITKDLTLAQAHWMVKCWSHYQDEYANRRARVWWYMGEGIRYDSQILRDVAELMLLI
jgi:hypothetical protein